MATKRILFSVFVVICLLSKGYSQHVFSKTYGHFDFNYGKDIIVEQDGYYILGNTSLNNGNSSPMLIKVDTAGEIAKFTYQNSNDILSASKFIRIEDKLFICGTKNNTSSNDYDCFLSIYDTSLTFIKTVDFGGSSWDFANKIAYTDTLIYIVGQTYSTPTGFSWGTISKFNLDGDSLATYFYGIDGEASINSLITRGDTELVFTGWYQAPDSIFPAAFAASSTLNGVLNWNKNLSADLGQSTGNDLTNGKFDNIYLCGTTEIYSATYKKDGFIYLLDSRGDSVRQLIQTHSNDDEMTSIVINASGNMITTGYTKTYGAGGKDFWLLEFDDNGYYQNGYTFGTQYDEIPLVIKFTPADSGAIICGTSYNPGLFNTSIIVQKINRTFEHSNTTTHEVSIQQFSKNNHISCYPNPASNYITVNCSDNERIEFIEIYDLLGHQLLSYNQTMFGENTIDISLIEPQILIIKAKTATGVQSFIIIKQK